MQGNDDSPIERQPPTERDLGVDIGTSSAGGSRPAGYRVDRGPSGSRWRALGLIAGPILVLAVVVGLWQQGGDEASGDTANDVARESAELPGDADESRPDPARPAPTLVQVPIVSDGLSRAGETCELSAGPSVTARFVVPDERTMRDCTTLVFNPLVAGGPPLAEVTVSDQSLGHELSRRRAGLDEAALVKAYWYPVDGHAGYGIERDGRLTVLVDAGGHTLIARQSDPSEVARAAFVDLLASIDVIDRGATEIVQPELAQPGGWCAGDHYVAVVVRPWFHGEGCRWLNTSGESLEVLVCQCFPPLWVEHGSLPFDGDFGFEQVDLDRLVPRADGSTVRIIEGLRRDPNNFERPMRAVIIDHGFERIMVMAMRFPEHTLPGHTWEDTLTAQDVLVQTMRPHSDPSCFDPSFQLVHSPNAGRVQVEVGDQFPALASGTRVEATGCTREGPRGPQVEVRLLADRAVLAWVDEQYVVSPERSVCPNDDTAFDPAAWDHQVQGDFDGDGLADTAFTRNLAVTQPVAAAEPNVAVVFADGGLAINTLLNPGPRDDLTLAMIGPPAVVSLRGADRDLLAIAGSEAAVATTNLYDLRACRSDGVPGLQLRSGTSGDVRFDWCVGRIGLREVIRSWEESKHSRQGWVAESDIAYELRPGEAAEPALFTGTAEFDSPPICGPRLARFQPFVELSTDSAPLAGEHPLRLQWITSFDGSVGTISFTPLGGERYEVFGTHTTPRGHELFVVGVIQVASDDELLFDGEIASRIPQLNDGAHCVREAGQRFVRRAGTNVFRLQDHINCDGARSDWIDIVLD